MAITAGLDALENKMSLVPVELRTPTCPARNLLTIRWHLRKDILSNSSSCSISYLNWHACCLQP